MSTFVYVLLILGALAGVAIYLMNTGKIQDDNNNNIPDVVEDTVEEVKEKVSKAKKEAKETIDEAKAVVKEVKRRAKRVKEELKDVKEGAEDLAAQVEDVIDAAAGKPRRGRPRKSPSKTENKK